MSLLRAILLRLLAIPITLVIITAALYGIIMLAPPEERASLYFPPRIPNNLTAEEIQIRIEAIIRDNGLDDPYPIQYGRWLLRLVRGDWGWSPTFNEEVLVLIKRRLPVTAELTFYAVLTIIPLALLSGVLAGWRASGRFDRGFRVSAFVGAATPSFILGLFLLSIFYVGLGWFPPERTSFYNLNLSTSDFRTITGFLTIDGLLNGRPDVTLDAFRHLVLPVISLGLLHWATVSRVTRVSVIDQRDKEYLVAARAKGLREPTLEWRHAFRNAMLPALTAGILSAAALVTGVYVIEVVFSFKGLSGLITQGFISTPDASLVMGFAVASVLLVLPIMLVLDLARLFIDPRLREEEL